MLERNEVVGLLVDRVYGSEATCDGPSSAPTRASRSRPTSSRHHRAPVVMAYGLFLAATATA